MLTPEFEKGRVATQFKKGVSGNLSGKPKGTKNLSTWIQDLLNDEKFEATIQQGYKIIEFKGAPLKAIVQAQMIKALSGDEKAFDLLAKYGYGNKLDLTTNGKDLPTPLLSTVLEGEVVDVHSNDSDQEAS